MGDTPTETVDLLVVGAGCAGLAAAKVYLQCAQETNLVVVDCNSSVGGTWAKERIYPGLRTNNRFGTLMYPDFPMHPGYGVKEGEHISGEAMHQYLIDYADHFGIMPRIRFNHKVLWAEKLEAQEDGVAWNVLVESSTGAKAKQQTYLRCRKMIVATGLTSQTVSRNVLRDLRGCRAYTLIADVKKLPAPIRGQADFDAPIISQPWLGQGVHTILDERRKEESTVTVVGGGKSAHDAVYMFAERGFKVNWVIRKSGYGPTYMALSIVKIGPWKVWLEMLTTTRVISWLSPCIWGDADGHTWIQALLHRTKIGRGIVNAFFNKVGSETMKQSGLTGHPSLRALYPDQALRHFATSIAILNYPTDLYTHVISGRVSVHRQDISHLQRHAVVLEDGTVLESPAGLVANANWAWAPNVSILPTSLHGPMGIASTEYTDENERYWAALDERADKAVLEKLPDLRDGPQPPHGSPAVTLAPTEHALSLPEGHPERPKHCSAWHLYRFTAPPSDAAARDPSIAFTGFTTTLLGLVRDEIVGLWIYAYFNGKLSRVDADPAYDAALKMQYLRRRFPYGMGQKYPDFVFEQNSWHDVLLQDLGLDGRRKGGWWPRRWFRNAFTPYLPGDYAGITQEWLARQGRE